jgi:hypothetical protein
MMQRRILIIRDWRVRYCLGVEYLGMPVGLGLIGGAVLGFFVSSAPWPYFAVLTLLGAVAVAINRWRRVHRLLGLDLDSQWTGP